MKLTQHLAVFMVTSILVAPPTALAQQPATPEATTLYEVVINGETFMIESNRLVKLQSGRSPETGYAVVLRPAPTQRYRLGDWDFDYDLLATVDASGMAEHRTVRLRHELGFTVLVTDLGASAGAEQAAESLQLTAKTMADSLRASGVQKLTIDEPQDLKESRSPGKGVLVRYQDRHGFEHTCLVCLFLHENRMASCVVEFFNRDQENAWPLIRKTIESVGPVRPAASGPIAPVRAAPARR